MTRTLPTKFEGKGSVKGFTFTLCIKSENMYIYEVQNGRYKHYEVFKIKTVPVCVDFEKRIYSDTEFKEIYPKDEDFGVWAWSFSSLESAYSKL